MFLSEKVGEGEEGLVLLDVVVVGAHQRGAVVKEEPHIDAMRAGLCNRLRAFHVFSGASGGEGGELLDVHKHAFSGVQKYNFFYIFAVRIGVVLSVSFNVFLIDLIVEI